MQPILKLNNIEVKYHEVILVLKGVSLEIPEGGIIALLGANGAGKSTTLKAISGLLKVEVGEVTAKPRELFPIKDSGQCQGLFWHLGNLA